MPIDLGLTRIATLLKRLGNPQLSANFIHIAGTNGKGSVCAYLSSLLQSNTQGYKIGKFTSPHLIYRHDCVTLNNNSVSIELFNIAEKEVLEVNQKYEIGATEFELLTATAFHLFKLEEVDLAVLEVGLGGRLDATNLIEPAVINEDGEIIRKGVLVTGITKIGLDHEGILGNTLEEIAFQKAGIIKQNISNVCDGTNGPEVLKVIKEEVEKTNSKNYVVYSDSNEINTSFGIVNRNNSPLKGDYQLQNLSLALRIIDVIFPFLQKSYPKQMKFTLDNIITGVQSTQWPGRLQSFDLKFSSSEAPLKVLLDGAHNGQAAKELHQYLEQTYGDEPITFVTAVTKGKDVDSVFNHLIRPIDKIIITKFGDVDGMPWIKANDPVSLKTILSKYTKNIEVENDLEKVFYKAANSKNVVVCGSLYLVGEVLKLNNANI